MSITSRKQEHVELASQSNVRFRNKSNGLDEVLLPYNALPEIDLAVVDTSTQFLGTILRLPLMVSGMTGGYDNAERINEGIARSCADIGIAFGVGSMRVAVEHPELRSTYSVVKQYSGIIPIVANIGAVQIALWNRNGSLLEHSTELCELVGASALAVHTNPLQESLQPEGQATFSGVLDAIAILVEELTLPVIVKEVGAGISGDVAQRLASVGVHMIDVAGAGGTSWAGVEILRREDADTLQEYWDLGIPTAECLRQCKGIVPTLIASGGIQSGTHIAHAIALGASMCGSALPILQAYQTAGTDGVKGLIAQWELDLRRRMFLTGSQTLQQLAQLIH